MNIGGIFSTIGSIGLLDAILAVLILSAAVYGFMKGIIRMAGDFFGVLIGIWVAGYYFITFYEWTQSLYLGYENIGRAISFLLILAVTKKLVSLVVVVIDRFIGFINIIPFFSLINRLAGAFLGFLSAGVFLGIAVYFFSRYSLGFAFDKMLVESSMAKFLFYFGEFVSPLLPEVLRQLHSLI
ncbi:hypothetical protein COT99_00565 [Candidatus Falkowbacteria bacterium CG10_big_fil_rev_8_21_14_0_10_43_10]|uniref:Colicin V production protein n=1 Tax=Candidatus Falkowbacteria bacterium CG10_big_fil_rev_8_21_14_0_10_43_10 TaxID=1974567 RepID=A0A2H0V300_9BACT|nr:MAG: hypothetical protein COT99_00565 [Candidatus Falkowbacteria bacterium CG10_big_fil_rev_8_21_14_0_10_43_10]